MKKVVITSGYFNPIHVGHINLIKEAKKLGDFLVVIVNNDQQVKIKGSMPFMPEQERIEIIKALKYADDVVLSVDKDGSVIESLKMVAKMYPGELCFAKGGDRNVDNIPEKQVCEDFNIKVINGVGGGKVQSSSWLLKNSASFGTHFDTH
jgi:cytidyltransferase-like protein